MTLHFLQLNSFSQVQIREIFRIARELKSLRYRRIPFKPFDGCVLAMIFEKRSTRTRVSFEAGIVQMGGAAIFLESMTSQIGRGEPISDTARVLSRVCDWIMIRTFEQSDIKILAQYSSVPVINGLSNEHHPCQVLSDIFTFEEIFDEPITGKKVAWIGDSNNVARSWAQAASILDFDLYISSPRGYELEESQDLSFCYTLDPVEAARDAWAINTDVFTSMGYEMQEQRRLKDFETYIVDKELLKVANPRVIFMHCLPAHRGEEVSHDVIEGEKSVVWQQAENRLHVQKALMYVLRSDIATLKI